MSPPQGRVRWCLAVVCVAGFMTTANRAQAQQWYDPLHLIKDPVHALLVDRKPHTGKDDVIECIAREIDWLEHHLDAYGTIVAKQPDVWGEARLTRHREEYERMMAPMLDQFEIRMNAALRRSDQSFLGMAMAMQAAVEGQTPPPASTTTVVAGMIGDPNSVNNDFIGRTDPFSEESQANGFTFRAGKNISLEPTIVLDQMSRYLHHLNELRRINEGDDTADSPGYALHLVRIPISILPGKHTQTGYGAEITITAEPYIGDELLATTFRNMVINDLVDQLAYPITRVVNTGGTPLDKHLHKIAQHHFQMDTSVLIRGIVENYPQDAAELVANSVVRDLGKTDPLLVEFLQSILDEAAKDAGLNQACEAEIAVKSRLEYYNVFEEEQRLLIQRARAEAVEGVYEDLLKNSSVKPRQDVTGGNSDEKPDLMKQATRIQWQSQRQEIPRDLRLGIDEILELCAPSDSDQNGESDNAADSAMRRLLDKVGQDTIFTAEYDRFKEGVEAATIAEISLLVSQIGADLKSDEFRGNVITISVPASPTRRARLPVPPSQLLSAYDYWLLAHVAADARSGLHNHPVNKPKLHLMDIRGFLLEELQAAHAFLSSRNLWHLAGPPLAQALRQRDVPGIEQLRNNYLAAVGVSPGMVGLLDGDTTRSLGWAILVEASLLNERLIQDIKDATAAKGRPIHCPEGMPFYDPNLLPDSQANRIFKEYVKCRWPIHVFALDPVTQDQNVADEFARRREMQLAMAMAFSGGQINAQAMMRYARRLEWDMATVQINRTVVGFSHGNDTFGWRFRPRFQTPPIRGNLVTFGETLFGGPTRNQELAQRQLEPGVRECTAIMVMPSFVPYAIFDTRTNWFKLTNPGSTVVSMHATMKYSRAIKSMETAEERCIQCRHLYRDGEVERLLRRVHQLDRELPLQTMWVQIPYENTYGGFEMFNRGITDLAPELIGWYGAPGLSRTGPTTLYLVGDGLSVRNTRLLAGGQALEPRLLSRQLMEVTVPAGLAELPASGDTLDKVVEFHLATPYGISNHLLVPVVRSEKIPRDLPTGWAMTSATIKVRFRQKKDATGKEFVNDVVFDKLFAGYADTLAIHASPAVASPAPVTVTFHVKHYDVTLGSFNLTNPAVGDAFRKKLEDIVGTADTSTSYTALATVVQKYMQFLLERDGGVGRSIPITVTAEVTAEGASSVLATGKLTVNFLKK